MNAYLATLVTFIIVLAFQQLMALLARRGWIESRPSRQLAYFGAGAIYVICWLLYPDGPLGPWLACLVPLLATIQFALLGLGIVKDDKTVNALTSSGDRREMLVGPLFYGLVFIALTLFYWRDSLVGIPALMMLCGASIAGMFAERRITSAASTFVAGWLLTLLVFAIYLWIGAFSGPFSRFLLPVTWIALGAALVELLPLRGFKSLIIPLACLLIGNLVF